MDLIQQIRKEEVPPGKIAFWWLGQAGYIIKTDKGVIIAIDPYLSNFCAKEDPSSSRMYPSPIRPNELTCDLCLLSHDHADHLDPETMQNLRCSKSTVFVGPRNCCKHLGELGIKDESIILLESGENVRVRGIDLKGVFCLPTDDEVLDSIGFLIFLTGGISIYHTGDTGYVELLHYLSKYSIDIMLTCINGKYGNMNCIEVAKLAKILNPRVVIPNHYDLFAHNQADPHEFEKIVIERGGGVECRVLEVGDKWIYPKC